jgi:cell division control protein 6
VKTSRMDGLCVFVMFVSSVDILSSTSVQSWASSALTLYFASYSSQQLLRFLQARLSPLYDTSECPEAAEHGNRFFPTATLTLLTKKIASQTGDVRALFEVLRGAINLAVKVPVADANPLATPHPIVRPDHILAALKVYLPSASTAHSSSASTLSPTSNETVSKVRNLGL